MRERIKVLLVEDNRADARLIVEVFRDQNILVDIHVVRDGEAAMDYLQHTSGQRHSTGPHLIILDLNLPKKDGREVLGELKADPDLRAIPVVILTTSQSEEDILNSYTLHASCYVTKPIDLKQFTEIIKSLDQFWFSAVRFPAR